MSTVLLNHYIYNNVEYTNIDELINVLQNNGITITKGQIPSNWSWQRTFWSNHGVTWYQSERESDMELLASHRAKSIEIVKTLSHKMCVRGIVLRDQYRVTYQQLNEMIVHMHAYSNMQDTTPYMVTENLQLTNAEIASAIQTIGKKYADMFNARNTALNQIGKAYTLTEIANATDNFGKYIESLNQ